MNLADVNKYFFRTFMLFRRLTFRMRRQNLQTEYRFRRCYRTPDTRLPMESQP